MVKEMVKDTEPESFLYLRLLFRILRRYWYWFGISISIFVAAALFYNWYTPPQYEAGSIILIDEIQPNTPDPSKDFMKSFSIFTPTSDIQREILKMKSSDLIRFALEQTNSEITYTSKVGIRKHELYATLPIHVNFDRNHDQPLGVRFEVVSLNNGSYRLLCEPTNDDLFSCNYKTSLNKGPYGAFSVNKVFKDGDTLATLRYSFSIQVDKDLLRLHAAGTKFFFEFNDLNSLTYEYQKLLRVEQLGKDIQAASIKIKLRSPEKGIDFINALTLAYQQRNVAKKNLIAEKTIRYFDKQLNILEDSLKHVEQNLQSFRTNNHMMELPSKSDLTFKRVNELELSLAELEARGRYFSSILNNVVHTKDSLDLPIPSSMGINDNVLSGMILDFMKLNSERNSLIRKKLTRSPAYTNVSEELANQKKGLIENIKQLVNANNISISNLEQRLSKGNAEIAALPKTETALTGIVRKNRLNDQLFTYLLEKKSEAEVAKGSNLPNNDIVESAKLTQLKAVTPNKTLNLALAFILGLVLPVAIMGIQRTLKNTISDEENIKQFTSYPGLGVICHNSKKKMALPVVDQSRKPIAESFRNVRTNLMFLLPKKSGNLVVITSLNPGEGKSFIALNLAASFARLGRKVILVDFDLRKEDVFPIIGNSSAIGLSTLLQGTNRLDDVLVHTQIPNLDLLPSGPIPENPVELVSSENTRHLIKQLKEQYDFVLIDSPPAGFLSDARILMEHTDQNLVVIRQDVTPQKQLASMLADLNSKNIANICWLLNDVDVRDTVFNNKRGYFG
jgi:tyrosine-protein kinase Etk/Wzc